MEWGGQFENLERARHRLYYIMPVTIAIIFALLFWAFRSATYAGLALLNVPFLGRGRRAGAVPARHQFECFGGGRLHLRSSAWP